TRCASCCNSSSSNWCPVHSTCHTNCCTDGTIESCDERCGGSGCSSGGSSGGGSYQGDQCEDYGDGYVFCCDDMSHPICNSFAEPCTSVARGCNFITNVQCGGIYDGYSIYYCG
ncbi:MAG: hypothetical protein IJ479_00595, partial [Alphaproteobacteria bacterium]|nr:hypothetical protein [Alphaproteobacteria bacterium]